MQEDSLFAVVRGEPTDAELAALTVVLAVAAAAPAAEATAADGAAPPRSAWSDLAARLRRPLPVGPGAWRTALYPYR